MLFLSTSRKRFMSQGVMTPNIPDLTLKPTNSKHFLFQKRKVHFLLRLSLFFCDLKR